MSSLSILQLSCGKHRFVRRYRLAEGILLCFLEANAILEDIRHACNCLFFAIFEPVPKKWPLKCGDLARQFPFYKSTKIQSNIKIDLRSPEFHSSFDLECMRIHICDYFRNFSPCLIILDTQKIFCAHLGRVAR